MRVLVCGGRDYQDHARVFAELDRLDEQRGITLVIHGACQQRGLLSGADRWAEVWARASSIPYMGWPGLGARMIEQAKPEVAVHFPGGNRTRREIRRARAAGVEVIEVAV